MGSTSPHRCLRFFPLSKPVRLLGVRFGSLHKMGERTKVPTPSDKATAVVEAVGGRYSAQLGIDLAGGKDPEIFKWFLASVLFGARISERLAMLTYRAFAERGLLTPTAIRDCGWNGLVAVLDAGGYVRYDFKTATKLLGLCGSLLEQYRGSLCRLHEEADSPADLAERIKALGKGVGDVTVTIFLRELRGIWPQAMPPLSAPALAAARCLGFLADEPLENQEALERLQRLWTDEGHASADFPDFEAALVRQGLSLRRGRTVRGRATH